MINVLELRIGSLFMNLNRKEERLFGIMGEFGKYLITPHRIDHPFLDLLDGYSPDECYPIVLTDKWMKKAGFKVNLNSDEEKCAEYTYSKGRFDVYSSKIMGDEEFWFDTIKISEKRYYTLGPLQYVHQLQNLYYSITNLELIFE